MLTSIYVRDFAIIDELEVEFGAGLTVLTGETGAGKSILVDALGLVLGDRADKTSVAGGAERAEISARFDLTRNERARETLARQDLDDGDECVLRRVIGADGRSRAYVNSRPVALQCVRELGETLVEIHGQHEHQTLTRPQVQRDIVDRFGKLGGRVDATADAFRQWDAAEAELRELEALAGERDSRLEFLKFQVAELDAAAEQIDNADALAAERDRLANVHKLIEAARDALQALDGDDRAAVGAVSAAASAIDRAIETDRTLAPVQTLLSEASASLNEAVAELQRYADGIDADPERRDRVERTLDELSDLARKHRVEIGELGDLRERLSQELDELGKLERRLDECRSAGAETRAAYDRIAADLSRGRKRAAGKLAAAVETAMQTLGMEGGSFRASVESDTDRARASGIDSVSFDVSANAGHPPAALGKVASGGELSRISLAIQVNAADAAGTPCLIFDEVDSGVGGRVAEIVGHRLAELGERGQVLAVTHLPQVASQGDQHLSVTKVTDGKVTRTRISALSGERRVEEIARMLGGVEITTRTTEHAREMLDQGFGARRRA